MLNRRWQTAIAAFLGLLCTACTTAEHGQNRSGTASATASATPLTQLPELAVSDDAFAGVDVEPSPPERRVLGEVRMKDGAHMLLYTQGNRCGVVTYAESDSRTPEAQLLAAPPRSADHGTTRLPYGPYLLAAGTGSGTPRAQLSLACGHRAMVVEYTSSALDDAPTPRGESAARVTDDTLAVVTADKSIRGRILSKTPVPL
ncbi:hypothetical protein OG746_37985 [Streptomyces sp. NBC_01016]|uniref:hypothetical protein n=1 Tax=Streptomyces sp. NBC_01016 TaxID=2903720 RepID=UPI0022550ED8|nr:hypothetical protein [Streptomyces sp. NBC_01016]MCX4834505.1 hypothetical protein [Streptomyces sp. NBC_01016]